MNDSPDPVAVALAEDVGRGDITTKFFVSPKLRGRARIVAREHCTIAGTQTAAAVFRRVDPGLRVKILRKDGSAIKAGAGIIEITGSAASILTAERVALNFLQRLSGISTLTRQFVGAVRDYPVKILDTRKTTPGLRALEKAAVVAGGGANHRFGLDDMVLVKDNHLSSAADALDLHRTIRKIRVRHPKVRIEVEADRLEQVREFLADGSMDVILLDNMTPAAMRKAVALGKRKMKFEASGGVTLQNVRKIAATGVDYISVGALTHSARAIDLSLELTHDAT